MNPQRTISEVDFLSESGKFTQRDPVVKNKARKLKESSMYDSLMSIEKYISAFKIRSDMMSRLWRKRTVSEIIEQNFAVDSSDVCILFSALSRECGIPAIFVEAIRDDRYRPALPGNRVCLSNFVDVFIGGSWKKYSPRGGFLNDHRNFHTYGDYESFGKGLDFSEIFPRAICGYGSPTFSFLTIEDIFNTTHPESKVSAS